MKPSKKLKKSMTKATEYFIFKDIAKVFDLKKKYFFDYFVLQCEVNGIGNLPISIELIQKCIVSEDLMDVFTMNYVFSVLFTSNPYCQVIEEEDHKTNHIFLFYEKEIFDNLINYCLTITFLKDNFVSFQIFEVKTPSSEIIDLWSA